MTHPPRWSRAAARSWGVVALGVGPDDQSSYRRDIPHSGPTEHSDGRHSDPSDRILHAGPHRSIPVVPQRFPE